MGLVLNNGDIVSFEDIVNGNNVFVGVDGFLLWIFLGFFSGE